MDPFFVSNLMEGKAQITDLLEGMVTPKSDMAPGFSLGCALPGKTRIGTILSPTTKGYYTIHLYQAEIGEKITFKISPKFVVLPVPAKVMLNRIGGVSTAEKNPDKAEVSLSSPLGASFPVVVPLDTLYPRGAASLVSYIEFCTVVMSPTQKTGLAEGTKVEMNPEFSGAGRYIANMYYYGFSMIPKVPPVPVSWPGFVMILATYPL
jgi:hypothetical protein